MAVVPPQQVRKLFVVGLGTTGTEVCDLLAKRLEDEFGSLDRVPWVQFQCFETNAAKGGLMSQRGKLMPLTIAKGDYQAMLADPSGLESVLHFSRYWDTETLRHIDDVSAGVGNVRMAGRLAFFHPGNFEKIEQQLPTEVSRLVNLSAMEAAEKRGALLGGNNPPIQFQADLQADGAGGGKSVVIVVVGTLCGGTGSGLCVDMGYYLRDKCGQNAHVISLFTLPHPDLSIAVKDTAERLKANSYAALRELHHFSQIGEVEYVAKYPTQNEEVRQRAKPYEIALLSWPREATKDSPAELHAALAERLFLLSFASADADPFATAVDVIDQYRDGGAADGRVVKTMFGTLGLGTLEHPGPRIMDYCAFRLQEYTLANWARREAPPALAESALAEMGVFWDQIFNDALRHAGGSAGDLRERLKRKGEAALEVLSREPGGWPKELDQIGMAFGDVLGSTPDANLPAGTVPKSLNAAQTKITDDLVGRVEAWVARMLMRWDVGPAVCREVVDAALTRLSEIQAGLAPGANAEPGLRGAADQLHDLRGDWLVSALFLYGRAARDVVASTRPRLNLYMEQRLRDAVAQVLMSGRSAQGIATDGALDGAAKRLKVLRRLLQRLAGGAGAYAAFCGHQKGILELPPNLSGEMLMRPGQADQEYREDLAPQGDAQAFAASQERAAVLLLGAWEGLAASMAAATPVYYDNPLPGGEPEVVGESALPDADTRILLDRARTQFQGVLHDDVLQRWAAEPNPNDLVQKLLSASAPFISLDTSKVLQLLGKNAAQQHLSVYPDQGSTRAEAVRFGGLLGNITKKPSGTKYRATVMQEFYGLPLEALRGIVRVNGGGRSLEAAVFTGWLTEARKNAGGWIPISPEERDRLAKFRQLLAVNIVMGLAPVRDQSLLIENYPLRGFGDVPERRLPDSFEEAARQWALSMRDKGGLDLESLENTLAGRISAVRSPSNQGDKGFLQMLEQRLPTAGTSLRDWDKKDIQALIGQYCLNDTVLRPLYIGIFLPGPAVLQALHYSVSQTTTVGVAASREGYYCINDSQRCGQFIGANEAEAEAQKWRCPACSTEYSEALGTYKQEWIALAWERKGQVGTPSYAPMGVPTFTGSAAGAASGEGAASGTYNPFEAV